MDGSVVNENDLNLMATELRLGLPGREKAETEEISNVRNKKRSLPDTTMESTTPESKAQIVGWPPIRSSRKNSFKLKKPEVEASGIYVKVSMDGAPYLRKIDLSLYKDYDELLMALENMFKFTVGKYSEREGYKGSEYAPTYEDKEGDWMLVGDVPWEMFMVSCKRMRIMKGSEVKGMGL